MNYFELYDNNVRNIEVEQPQWEQTYDVIVSGAGSSGIYSALAAAREGKKVLLLEKGRWCGGMHVQGLINGYYYGGRGGIYEETDRRSREIGKNTLYNDRDAKRLVIGRILEENHVEAHVSSVVLGIYTDGTKVVGVKAILDRTVVTVKCSMLVDATSDGHLLRMLPIKTYQGRESDSQVQPFSSVRYVCIDKTTYQGSLRVNTSSAAPRYTIFHEYRDNGYVNQYDQDAYTAAIINSHAGHLEFMNPTARFLCLAPLIGVREGLLYEGEQTTTLTEVLEEKNKPENILVNCFSDIDKHGSDIAFDDDSYQDWFVNCNLSTVAVFLPLPVGSFVPKNWKGFITTGRCMSSDTYVNSAVRMNSDCFRIGEACGVLAAMAADYAQDPMAVPYPELKEKLVNSGFLAKEKLTPPSFWSPFNNQERTFITWMTEAEEIKKALSTNCPAIALWSCKLLGKEVIGDAVYEMSKTDDEMLHYNAGIALGIMKDERALPILREIIKDRKPFYFMDCRRSNQMRSVIAISLIGRMKDDEIIDELLEIIKPEEFDRPMYHELLDYNYKLTIVNNQNSVYFQHFSYAVVSLVKIARSNEKRRAEITEALHAALDDESYIDRITSDAHYNAYYKGALNCKLYFEKYLANA